MRVIFFAFTVSFALVTVHAANTPCSGRKGGVSHCNGQHFICNDGSTSQSKKVCSTGDYAPPDKPAKGKKQPPR